MEGGFPLEKAERTGSENLNSEVSGVSALP